MVSPEIIMEPHYLIESPFLYSLTEKNVLVLFFVLHYSDVLTNCEKKLNRRNYFDHILCFALYTAVGGKKMKYK